MKSSPPTPDYKGAAEAQGQSSLENTAYQTYANRPNISTPWGGVRWTPPSGTGYGTGAPANPNAPRARPIGSGGEATGPFESLTGGGGGGNRPVPRGGGGDSMFEMWSGGRGGEGGVAYRNPGNRAGGSDLWGMEMYLSPDQQAALDSQMRIGASRSGTAEDLFGQVRNQYSSPMSWAGLPGAPNPETARESAIGATFRRASSRLNPMWEQRSGDLESKLLNQGLRPGTEAYDRATSNLGRERTDAYQQALDAATMAGESAASGEFGRGLTGRQQGISELFQRRNAPLNEVNALLGGQQVNMPQMPGFNPAGVAQTTPYLQAAGMQYQAGLNSSNAQQAMMQGLMQGGQNALQFLPFML